jgi:hypothetical protein
MKTSILQSMLKRNANAIHVQEMHVRYFQESYKDCKNYISDTDQWKRLLINSISVAKKDIKKLVAIQRAIKAEIKLNTYDDRYNMQMIEIDNWIKEHNNAI